MTNLRDNSGNHPDESATTPRNKYKPVTWEQVRASETDPFFAGLENSSTRILGGFLFIAIFFMLSAHAAGAAPVTLVILLACMLYRMNPRERKITAIPLTFSAIELARQFAGDFGMWGSLYPNLPQSPIPVASSGINLLPLFFSAYLFFSPWKESYTGRLFFWESLILLLSGLLPGGGCLVIAAMLYYTLFIAVVVCLALDLHPHWTANSNSAARPLPSNP